MPHDRGPAIGGTWLHDDAAPLTLTPIGAPDAGQWLHDRGAGAPGEPGAWRHRGVVTLRTIEGRYFLTGTLDRTPARDDDDSYVVVEYEVLDAAHLRLRSSVFHDPGAVGWSFAYHDQDVGR
ncbi:MAG: hypothetical protein H6709_10340 [Kofleriaceae bacterium]|nr:hypothetical protein [Kofleriaceae bacterium]